MRPSVRLSACSCFCADASGGCDAGAGAAARASEAAAAMQSGQFDAAAAIYDELVAARPNDAGLLMNLGMARYMAGHPDQALPVLRKAVRLNASLGAGLALSRRVAARPRAVCRRHGAAPAAVTLMPKNPDAREMLARSYLGSSRPSKAAPQYRTLTTLQPSNPKAWYGLARSYEGIAEASFVGAPEGVPDSPLLKLIVADIAATQEKYPAALASTAARSRTASRSEGCTNRSRTSTSGPARASGPRPSCAKVKPRTAAYCATGAAECRVSRSASSARRCRPRSKSTGAVARFWTVRAANRLAVEAVGHLETLPSSAELHLIRAEIAQSRSRNPEGVSEVRAALELEPGNPAIESALAEALCSSA